MKLNHLILILRKKAKPLKKYQSIEDGPIQIWERKTDGELFVFPNTSEIPDRLAREVIEFSQK